MGKAAARKRGSQSSMQDLLAAAIEVFAQRGPEAATVDEISRKAGLNKRMIYHYFGSKEQLYRQSLQYVYEQFRSLDISLSAMLLPVEELVETLVRQYYTFLHDHPNFVRLISYENLSGGEVVRQLGLGGQKAQIITALRLALEKGKAERQFRSGIDVPELLVSILALCFFYFSNANTMGEFVSEVAMTKPALERRVAHVVDLLLHGIVDVQRALPPVSDQDQDQQAWKGRT